MKWFVGDSCELVYLNGRDSDKTYATYISSAFEQLPGEREDTKDDIEAAVIHEDNGTLVGWFLFEAFQPRWEVVNQPGTV